MEALLGTSVTVFVVVTVVMVGFAAYMTGQALASTWRPFWQVLVYCCLFGLASRFLIFGLFQGDLLSPTGYLLDVLVFLGLGGFAFCVTRARRMTSQYPWLYERAGMFGWRRRL
jgi:hypothetical protein